VLERTDQPLAEDLPLMREIRATISKCLENGMAGKASGSLIPRYSGLHRSATPRALLRLLRHGLARSAARGPDRRHRKHAARVPPSASSSTFPSISCAKGFEPQGQEIHQQQIREAYPQGPRAAVRGSENPNLLPKGAITVRMHSVGGWGAITTGKNLAVTLNELLGYDIKANPKYGSEKKGQPTTYYLSAAPEPIKINCEYHYVDVVLESRSERLRPLQSALPV
jgi:pyruvate-ferredoxin/flavodoxin oxidoreductase